MLKSIIFVNWQETKKQEAYQRKECSFMKWVQMADAIGEGQQDLFLDSNRDNLLW